MEATGSTCKRRWLECCHLSMPSPRPVAWCWTSLCAACLYIISMPDTVPVYTCVYIFVIFCGLRFSPAHSDDSQNYACNCSMFCACTQLGLPHNVMHFLVYEVLYLRPSMATDCDAWIYRSLSRERSSHDLSLWHSALLPSCQSIIRLCHSALRGKEEIKVSDSENKAHGCHLQGESPYDKDEYEEI